MEKEESEAHPASLPYADPGTRNAEDPSDDGSAMVVGGIIGLIVANVVLCLWLRFTPSRSMDDAVGTAIIVALGWPLVWLAGIALGVLTVFLYRRFR